MARRRGGAGSPRTGKLRTERGGIIAGKDTTKFYRRKRGRRIRKGLL